MPTISGPVVSDCTVKLQKGTRFEWEGKWKKSVKVFLRNTQTGWYYQGPSQWTPEQGAALDLGQVARAVERIFEAHIENVEILLCYDDPRYDLVLPVPPSPSRAESSGRGKPAQDQPPAENGKSSLRHKKGPRL